MSQQLKNRTKKFAIETIRFLESIQITVASRIIKRQLVRSATSVGANYRAACRAKSDKDYINKLKICEEESDECCYWLELLADLVSDNNQKLQELKQESSELTAIFVSSIKKVKSRVYN